MSSAKTLALLASILVAITVNAAAAQTKRTHNVILFVPDGLRALSVTPENAPAMAGVRDSGVNFRNSHSIFPTFTTANASAMATGHHLGDTGDWSNTIYVGRPVAAAGNSVTPCRVIARTIALMSRGSGIRTIAPATLMGKFIAAVMPNE